MFTGSFEQHWGKVSLQQLVKLLLLVRNSENLQLNAVQQLQFSFLGR